MGISHLCSAISPAKTRKSFPAYLLVITDFKIGIINFDNFANNYARNMSKGAQLSTKFLLA